MSNERKSPNSARPAVKLSDTQLVLLSAAAQRDDHCLTATPNLKGGAAQKVAEKLIAVGLAKEIKAKAGVPIWRRDEESAQSFALKLTAAGLKAIGADDGAVEEEAAAAGRQSIGTLQRAAPADDLARGPNTTRLKAGEGSVDDLRKPQEAVAPSAPRSGSKTAEIINLLQRDQGVTLDDLIAATGWLPHTMRAALTGLRKRGYEIGQSRLDGVARYKIEGGARASTGLDPSVGESASAALRDEQAA